MLFVQVYDDGSQNDWETHVIPVRDITISDLTTLSFLLGNLIPGQKYNVRTSFENSTSPIVTSYLQRKLKLYHDGSMTEIFTNAGQVMFFFKYMFKFTMFILL